MLNITDLNIAWKKNTWTVQVYEISLVHNFIRMNEMSFTET